MKPIATKDGSVTFFNEQFGEHYHSTSGAEEESIKKFAQPLQVYLEEKDTIRLLDVCFGLGYNTSACIELYANKYPSIEIIALEADVRILAKMQEIETSFACYPLLVKAIQTCMQQKQATFTYRNCEIIITLMLGDARESIQQVSHIDGVLFDPFSPKQHPEMWTQAFLADIKTAMNKGAALTTYSCARTFRDTLRALHMEVVNGPCVGRKAPSTIAVKKDL